MGSGAPGWFVALFVSALAFIALVFVFIVVSAARMFARRRALARAGLDPAEVTLRAVSRFANGGNAESRLRELQGLRDQGLVTQEEYDARRAEIVREI
jgi:cytochrome c-type biogenesis protein CcmH/NrfG